MRLTSIETRAYRLPLDPPFVAAWDPLPRTHLDATLTIVAADDGSAGYASGDALPDRSLLERHLRGQYVLCQDDGNIAPGHLLRDWLKAAQRRAGLAVTGRSIWWDVADRIALRPGA